MARAGRNILWLCAGLLLVALAWPTAGPSPSHAARIAMPLAAGAGGRSALPPGGATGPVTTGPASFCHAAGTVCCRDDHPHAAPPRALAGDDGRPVATRRGIIRRPMEAAIFRPPVPPALRLMVARPSLHALCRLLI